MTEQNKNEVLEKKWREEFEDIEREHYSLDQWRHLYLKTNGDYTYECKKRWDRYLAARLS